MTQIQRMQALLALAALSAAATAVLAFWPTMLGHGLGVEAPFPMLALVAAVSAAGAALALQKWRVDLRAFARRARKVHEGSTVSGEDMPLEELHSLAEALAKLGGRLQRSHDAQSQQLEHLRRLAHTDSLTGLAHRRHFLSRLAPEINAGDGPGAAGLLLVRVPELQALNRRIGHVACDDVLRSLAQALDAYSARVPGCFAGRLNGTDFALWLPAGGVAHDTAQAVLASQGKLLTALDSQARLVAAAVELIRPLTPGQALAVADEALARAEAQPGFGLVPALAGAAQAACARGEADWRRGIDQALTAGRVSLGSFAVCDAAGMLLHLDCPLRLRFEPDGPAEPAARWLALALRSRLTPRVDEQAVSLALEAIEVDGVGRCVNVAADSLLSMAFLAAMRRLQSAHAQAWTRLWIDLPARLVDEGDLGWVEIIRPWRAAGAKVGLEHAGDRLTALPSAADQALDYVRIDGRYVAGIAEDEQASRYAQAIVTWARALGLSVFAESVARPSDLAALWQFGFDGATGPALAANSLAPTAAAVLAISAAAVAAARDETRHDSADDVAAAGVGDPGDTTRQSFETTVRDPGDQPMSAM
ncbi:MAG: EAL domain-containing protein [Aquabacterium sp.]